MKVKAGTYEEPRRYTQQHEMFERLATILVDGVTTLSDRHWLPMAEQAVGVIYKLAEHPDVICGNILKKLAAKCVMLQRQQQQQQELSQTEPVAAESGDDILTAAGGGDSQSSTSQQSSSQSQDGVDANTTTKDGGSGGGGGAVIASCPAGVLSRLLGISGHVALQQLVLLDCDMFNELKRRHALRETDAVGKKTAEQESRQKQRAAAAANKRKSMGKVGRWLGARVS